MAEGKGFAALLSYVAALNAEVEKTPALLDRISTAPLDAVKPEVAAIRAEIERLTAELAALSPDRSAPDISKAEIEERDRLRALASRRLAAAEEKLSALEQLDTTAAAAPSAPAMVRILGQMRAIQSGAEEAERSIESLSERTEEASSEVVLKISKALAAILDPGNGEGVSGRFDKETGQFLGGGLSYERARDFVDRYLELQDLKKQKLTAFEEYYVNDSITKTVQQFAKEFGSKLGDLKSLAKQLREYMNATAKKDVATGPTSGTLGRPKPASASASSIAVLRWTGGLR